MIFDRALSGQEIDALADADNDSVLSVTATEYDKAGNLTVDYRGYQYSYDYDLGSKRSPVKVGRALPVCYYLSIYFIFVIWFLSFSCHL